MVSSWWYEKALKIFESLFETDTNQVSLKSQCDIEFHSTDELIDLQNEIETWLII